MEVAIGLVIFAIAGLVIGRAISDFSLKRTVNDLIDDQKLRVLTRKIKLGTHVDEYGVTNISAADKEFKRFLDRFIAPHVEGLSGTDWRAISTHIRRRIARIEAADCKAGFGSRIDFAEVRNGLDYEAFVADGLLALGWDARIRKLSSQSTSLGTFTSESGGDLGLPITSKTRQGTRRARSGNDRPRENTTETGSGDSPGK